VTRPWNAADGIHFVPSWRLLEGLILGGWVVGVLASAHLIVSSRIPFARWGGVALVSQLVNAVVVAFEGLIVYTSLGIVQRITGWKTLGSSAWRFGFSLAIAAVLLPAALWVNVRRPGFSLSVFHVGPYVVVLFLTLGVAVGAGYACAWLHRTTRIGFGVPRPLRITAILLVVLSSALSFLPGFGPDDPGSDIRRSSSGERGAPEDLNAVLITVDTLRLSHLQSFGYHKATDPEIQRHFRKGLRFEHAVSPVPVTRPTHAAMLTGIHPLVLGMRWNEHALPDDATTLAEVLQSHGYRTAAFVSGWPLFGERSGLDRGFDLYSDVFSPLLVVEHALDDLAVVKLLRKLGFIDTLKRDAAAVTEDALRWLESSPPEPFFLWIHYYDPHGLYEPPVDYARQMGLSPEGPHTSRRLRSLAESGKRDFDPRDREELVALYDGEIRHVDYQTGRLLDTLEDLGLDERTIVLLTADHGETLFERLASEGMAFTHGKWLSEWDIRVPFLLRGPGIPARNDSTVTAQSMDVMPTLLGALGLPVPDGIMGLDLTSLDSADAMRGPAVSINSPGDDESSTWISSRSGEYKLLVEAGSGREYLYHLPSDPEERNNLIAELPEIAGELRKAVQAFPIVTKVDALDPEELDRLRALGYVH